MTKTTLHPASISETPCPSCGEGDLRWRGLLPDADYFAGRNLATPLPGGSLYECKACGLNFRWPRLAKEEADALYCEGDDANWSSPAERRPDWQLAGKWISELGPGKSVLDIACFDGRFLRSLGEHHQRYGIEIHPRAAERARGYGVDIVASDFAQLSQVDRKFSVITAFDILEHVHEPSEFLACVSAALEPGGLAIIGTGNTDARSWQFMGTNYWYCANLEHVSFINPRWCQSAAASLNLEVDRIARLSHCYPTISKICRERIMNILYRVSPRSWSSLRYRFRARFAPHKRNPRNEKPAWFSAKDHLLVTFRKPRIESDSVTSRNAA